MDITLSRAELEAAWGYALGSGCHEAGGYLYGAMGTVVPKDGQYTFKLGDSSAVEVLAILGQLAEERAHLDVFMTKYNLKGEQ